MSDAAFDKVIGVTLDFEGGYANDPADPGGETNFGISKRSYPDLDIANLTREDAVEIYRRDFWPPWRDLPDLVGAKCFDLGVNMGVGAATRVLQRALIELGQQLAVDGVLGPATHRAAAAVDADDALDEIVREAEDHYRAIVKNRPASAKFLRGWLRRAGWRPEFA